jgi:hypothetical protein
MDQDHFKFYTTNMPKEMHDQLKKIHLENGLLLNSDNTDEKGLIKLIGHHRNGNLGA